jgi:hypothetical protein
MSSLPNQPTFLESYKKINDKEQILLENKLVQKYKKEIKYVEEEIQYWKTENEFNPSESKKKKIQELEFELKNIQKIYENMIKETEIN